MPFTKAEKLAAIHVPYTDAYWSELEERGTHPPAGAELCSMTEPGPEAALLDIADRMLDAVEKAWGIDPAEVFAMDDAFDVDHDLADLFMGMFGHGVYLGDEFRTGDALERVSAKLGRNLEGVGLPYFDAGPLHDLAYERIIT